MSMSQDLKIVIFFLKGYFFLIILQQFQCGIGFLYELWTFLSIEPGISKEKNTCDVITLKLEETFTLKKKSFPHEQRRNFWFFYQKISLFVSEKWEICTNHVHITCICEITSENQEFFTCLWNRTNLIGLCGVKEH